LILLPAFFLASCAGQTGSAGNGSVTGNVTVASVTVAPQAATVPTGGSTQFVATVQNSSSTLVQWEVNRVPGGSDTTGWINSSGVYQAPASVPNVSVEVAAVLQADARLFGSATVTILEPISVSPRQAALTTSQTVQLQATGLSAGTGGVTWSADGGTITEAGLYTPTGPGTFTVTATSKTDASNVAQATVYVTDLEGQYSWRNDPALTGQNTKELALSPATLASGSFGKISSCAVDGQVHAQPLYAANLSDGSGVRNVLYVATEHNSVYAFDADAIPCQQIWKTSFLDEVTDTTSVPGGDIPGNEIMPEVGISGTPVIDRASNTPYVVAKTKQSGPSGPQYVQRLHALDLVTGAEKLGGPVVISASAAGTGDGSSGGPVPFVAFDPLTQSQRAALLLRDGKLYVTFGGRGSGNFYHGWLLIYDATTLAQVGVFNSTPNGSRGGFSENGAGVSADDAGNVFAATGHGTFNSSLSVLNFAQTLLKLPLDIANLATYTFTPPNQIVLTDNNHSLGSSGVVILPEQAPNPRLAVVGASDGTLYLLNRDNLGGFSSSGIVKSLNVGNGIHGTPAYWQDRLYVAAAGEPLKAYSLSGGTLASMPSAQSNSAIGGLGASPTVSSSAGSGGIVWVVDTGGANSGAPAILRVFDATDVSRELYNSGSKPGDAAGPAATLAVPTVVNGKVYVGTQNEVTVYGLLP
jgi:hypothetical protein